MFLTKWSYADRLLLPAGTSEGTHRHPGIEEVYYVMNGEGEVRVNDEKVRKGDGVPVFLNDAHSFRNTGSGDLELMIVGVAGQKYMLETVEGPAPKK